MNEISAGTASLFEFVCGIDDRPRPLLCWNWDQIYRVKNMISTNFIPLQSAPFDEYLRVSTTHSTLDDTWIYKKIFPKTICPRQLNKMHNIFVRTLKLSKKQHEVHFHWHHFTLINSICLILNWIYYPNLFSHYGGAMISAALKRQTFHIRLERAKTAWDSYVIIMATNTKSRLSLLNEWNQCKYRSSVVS